MSLSRQRKEESDGKEDKIVRRSDSEDIIEEWIQEDVEGEERECAQGGEEMQDPDEALDSKALQKEHDIHYVDDYLQSSISQLPLPSFSPNLPDLLSRSIHYDDGRTIIICFSKLCVPQLAWNGYLYNRKQTLRLRIAIYDLRLMAEFTEVPLRCLHENFMKTACKNSPQISNVVPPFELTERSLQLHRKLKIYRRRFAALKEKGNWEDNYDEIQELKRRKEDKNQQLQNILIRPPLRMPKSINIYQAVCMECLEKMPQDPQTGGGGPEALLVHLAVEHDCDFQTSTFNFHISAFEEVVERRASQVTVDFSLDHAYHDLPEKVEGDSYDTVLANLYPEVFIQNLENKRRQTEALIRNYPKGQRIARQPQKANFDSQLVFDTVLQTELYCENLIRQLQKMKSGEQAKLYLAEIAKLYGKATSEINMTRGEQSEEPEESSGTVEILERDSVRRGVKREWESTNEVVIKEADKQEGSDCDVGSKGKMKKRKFLLENTADGDEGTN